jgi:hypothetical protein
MLQREVQKARGRKKMLTNVRSFTFSVASKYIEYLRD